MNTELALTGTGIDPLTIIAQSDLSETTKEKYTRVLRLFLAGGGNLGDPVSLAEFAVTLPVSRRAHLKAAVGKWAKQMTVLVKGQATPDNVGAAQASVMRFEALAEAIKVKTTKGTKAHTWLSKAEVQRLSNEIGDGIVGARDRAALGLLVGAGLRREEAVSLTFEDIKYQPVGERMRAVLAVKGKGAKDRTVPISDKLAGDLDTWGKHLAHTGPICRALGRNREPGASAMSAVALFKLVRKYGARIDKPDLAPHDLRRTYAQIGYSDGVPITQISTLLGHANVATTQRYLNLELDLAVTASDFVPW